jgi:DNA-directed RNA polymerase subunit RPC12/RpoP
MKNQCPGMNPQNWKPEDIKEYKCINCSNEIIEFWKDDVKRVCPGCGKFMFNPDLGNVCLSWCDRAEDCIGNMDITEWKQKKIAKSCNDAE